VATASQAKGRVPHRGKPHSTCRVSPQGAALGIIAGQAPGLKEQDDLFTDALGHGKPPLMALVGYCDFAVIYRRSPGGLPVPAILKQAKLEEQEESLNRLLQELAWDAVLQHPLSGLRRRFQ
jgi:hypothetical protein